MQTYNLPIGLTSGAIQITNDLTIEGNAYASAWVDGTSMPNDRLFEVVDAEVTFKNMLLTNGGSASFEENGSAIAVRGKTNIINCDFQVNRTDKNGGAVFLESANNSYIVNSKFRHNSANESGGAVYTLCADAYLVNNLFHNNTARWGGALRQKALSGDNCDLDQHLFLYSNTFAENDADISGGGVVHSKKMSYYNNIFAYNTALNGPDIYRTGFSVGTIVNSESNFISDLWNYNSLPGFTLADPLFETLDGTNYHLSTNSPCRNTGNTNYLLPDYFDLDEDSNESELHPRDIDGNRRVSLGSLDAGAFERIPEACESAIPLNCDNFYIADMDNARTIMSCTNSSVVKSAFYSIQVNNPTTAIFYIANYFGEKEIYLYDNLCNGYCNTVASSNQGNSTEEFTYNLLPGVTYYLEIFDGNNSGGECDLDITCTTAPVCDYDLYLTSPTHNVDGGILDFSTNESIFAKNTITETGDSYFICGPDGNDVIVLLPGFEVLKGGLFQTFQYGCEAQSANNTKSIQAKNRRASSPTKIKADEAAEKFDK